MINNCIIDHNQTICLVNNRRQKEQLAGKEFNYNVDKNFVFIMRSFNSFFSSSDFCHLLITFANSLDPDQDRLCVGPDLGPNC